MKNFVKISQANIISSQQWEAQIFHKSLTEAQKCLNQWKNSFHLRDVVITPLDATQCVVSLWRMPKEEKSAKKGGAK